MRRAAFASVVLVCCLAGVAVRATASAPESSRNMRQLALARFAFEGDAMNTAGMAFDGSTLVATGDASSDTSGVGIFRISQRAPFLRQVGFQECPGMESVTLWGRYLIQSVDVVTPPPSAGDEPGPGSATPDCDGRSDGEPREGVRISDISDPQRPRFVKLLPTPGGSAGHAVARFGRRVYIYEANDLSPEAPADDQTKTFEIRVFRFFPRHPERTYLASHARLDGVSGCQNVTIFVPRRLGVCTGLNMFALLDLADPVNPETLFVNAANDSAAADRSSYFVKANFTWDGRYLLLGKLGTGLPCSDEDGPQNDLIVYDVEDASSPTEVGRFSLPRDTTVEVRDETRGVSPALWNACSPYSVQVLPLRDPARYIAVLGFVSGGVSVVDLSDVSNPREIGYFAPEATHVPFAHWYQGRIYAAEDYSGLGIRVLKMSGLTGRRVHAFRRRLTPNVQVPDFR